MGKKANEKRKAWVEEVKQKDKAKKRPGKFSLPKRYTKEQEKPRNPIPVHKQATCCFDKYESLPEDFKQCIDCPKLPSFVADGDNAQDGSAPLHRA